MDFMGFRSLEQESWISESLVTTFSYATKALLYDPRFRKSSECQRKLAVTMRIVVLSCNAPQRNTPSGLLTQDVEDEYERIAYIYNMYYHCEPQYIDMTSFYQCEQRRESFKHWLASKLSILRFGQQQLMNTGSNSHLLSDAVQQWKESHLDMWLLTLLRNYICLPWEVVLTPSVAMNFPLPVICGKEITYQVSEDWLALMSWWKLIGNKILPILCTLRRIYSSRGSGEPNKCDKVPELVKKLSQYLKQCDEQKVLLNLQEDADLEPEHDDLEEEGDSFVAEFKRYTVEDQEFVEDVVAFSVKMAHATTIYLINMQMFQAGLLKINPGNDTWFIRCTRLAVEIVFNNVQKLFYRKPQNFDEEEDYTVGLLLETVGKTLKRYRERKFFISSQLGDAKELYQQRVRRVQKFFHRIMDTVGFALLTSIYKFFPLKIKRQQVLHILHYITLHISWNSMKNLLRQHHRIFDEESLQVPKASEVYGALIRISPGILNILQPTVDQCMVECNSHLFRARPEGADITILPLSAIYGDFQNFLRGFSQFFYGGPQPLQDLNGHTDGRLTKLMTETLISFYKCRDTMEDVLESSRNMLLFIERSPSPFS